MLQQGKEENMHGGGKWQCGFVAPARISAAATELLPAEQRFLEFCNQLNEAQN